MDRVHFFVMMYLISLVGLLLSGGFVVFKNKSESTRKFTVRVVGIVLVLNLLFMAATLLAQLGIR